MLRSLAARGVSSVAVPIALVVGKNAVNTSSRKTTLNNRKQKAAIIRGALGTRSIVMVGMMGCGKSAIGRRLAQALGLSFVDADEEIEKAAGKSIAEIFAEHGEPYFRDGERRVIARLLSGGPQVLATGGGAFMDERTREAIKAAGVSVWLDAEVDILIRRVARRDNRPLLRAGDIGQRMRELLAQRVPFYASADITVQSREVAHDAMIEELMTRLADEPGLTRVRGVSPSTGSAVDVSREAGQP